MGERQNVCVCVCVTQRESERASTRERTCMLRDDSKAFDLSREVSLCCMGNTEGGGSVGRTSELKL